jgi:2-polyprenyl-3-methyl-5-hydroxy-6-metoxy-1,4-benzoquinol methylase
LKQKTAIKITQEYQHPALYDCEYGNFTQDFDIFSNYSNSGGVLDLACGTGRLTIELAKRGLQCVGIDKSASMLSMAQAKSKALGLNIFYLQEDIRKFQLEQKFDLITMAGNSFQALLNESDQRSCLACVSWHLKRCGFFIFNTRNTVADEMKTSREIEYWHDFLDANGNRVKVYGTQHYDSFNNTVLYTTKRVWQTHHTLSKITLKFTNFPTLLHLLNQAGFEILEVYGSFSREPFDSNNSKDIIIVSRKKLWP